MTEFDRQFFKNDPVFRQLHALIVDNHKVARHTQQILYANRHKKDFCEQARCFVMLVGPNQIHLHYDVTTWWKEPNGVQVRVDSMGVYDNFLEYETERLKSLHSGQKSDIPNIN